MILNLKRLNHSSFMLVISIPNYLDKKNITALLRNTVFPLVYDRICNIVPPPLTDFY